MNTLISKENGEVDCCRQLIEQFKHNLPRILENPVMKEFVNEKENMELLNKAMESLEEDKLQKLDNKFREFYRLNRIIRYLTGLIKRYPIDYDKRVKVRNQRYQLVIDKPITNGRDDANATMGDLLANNERTPYEHLEITEKKKDNLFVTENPMLSEAIRELNPKQHEILYLYYEKGFNNKAIGELFGQTEQNISYWHKKTLRQIKGKLTKQN